MGRFGGAFTPPPETIGEIMGALQRFRERNASHGISYKVKKTRDGHPLLKFGDYSQAFAATMYLANLNVWKRFSVSLVHKGEQDVVMHLPYAGATILSDSPT